ncbi:MAG: site-2 protease family protein [Pseudomonadota bacterium]
MSFDLSPQRIREAVVFLIALVLSIAVHEFGHAIMADKLGDRTPRSQGRVTLNPLAHADPIGTLLFPLIALLTNMGILFGWGKPVLINPMAFTRRFRKKVSHLFVALAGPAMNVILALIVTIIFGLGIATKIIQPDQDIANGLIQVIMLNWVLFFFNLIPCPPLDGGAVLAGILPDRHQNIIEFLQRYGFLILIGLLVTGAVSIFVFPARWITIQSILLMHRIFA